MMAALRLSTSWRLAGLLDGVVAVPDALDVPVDTNLELLFPAPVFFEWTEGNRILLYEDETEGEVCVAVDEGVLVKSGFDVLISVRNAIGGTDLGQLREAVEREFLHLNEREQSVRSVMAKMESGFVRRLVEFHHE